MPRKYSEIPHTKPCLGKAEANAAAKVAASGHLACGKETALFERELAKRFGIKNAVAVSSGTKALELALMASGTAGGEVIIPTYCCSALWHAAKAANAIPVLADCDPITLNPSPENVRAALTKKTRAVILPNLFGLPCDPRKYKLPKGVTVISDCAQASGAEIDGKFAGAYGDICTLSLYATKLFTAGEGGVVLCGNKTVADAVRDLREYDGVIPDHPRQNAKMTDMQSAIGRVQLGRLDGFLEKRLAAARLYDRLLAGTGLLLPPDDEGRVYHRYVVQLAKPRAETVLKYLAARGIMARKPIFRPLHLDVPCKGRFPNTEAAYLRAISLPLFPQMTAAAIRQTVSAMQEALKLIELK